MLQTTTFKFLRDLHRNNNRDWFEKNRNRFLAAKEDFETLVEAVISEFSKHNPKLKGLQVKDCTFRIYRDIRFSKDKTPYKTSFSATIGEEGRQSKAGFYFQIDPAGEWKHFLAGGMWKPEAALLKAVRQEIEYHTDEFLKLLNNKKFRQLFGEMEDHKLKKTPKGVDKDDPNAELFKYTSFIVSRNLEESGFSSKSIVKDLTDSYRTMLPFLDFLNRAGQ